MTGTSFAQGSVIGPRAQPLVELALVQDLCVGIAERIPLVFPLPQAFELRRLGDHMQIAPFEIAIDLVFGDALDDQFLGFFGNGKAFDRIFLAELCFDALLAGREAGADLPAIAPRCAIADLAGLEHDDLVAGFGQLKGGRKTGESSPDNADIGR